MIFGNISDAARYAAIDADINLILEAAAGYGAEGFPSGRKEVSDRAFMIFSSYQTHPLEEAFAEAHRKYADVFVMIEGTENVYVKPTDRLKKITKEYDSEKDVLIALRDPDVSAVRLSPGDFLILFPEDAHSPGCFADGKQCAVKKIIGKVRI